jgi:serine/threonine protein kinase
MRCASCGHENPDRAKFCLDCGSRFSLLCASCGTELPPSAKFCLECGEPAARPAAAAGAVAPSITPPTSFASGRYRIQRFLGEGAKKRVYLATDTRLSREVALAVIKTEGLDDEGRIRVRREAEAMGRLGDHPNIVTVYDVAEEQGQIFLVAQYMAGGDLEGRLRVAQNRRLPLEETLGLAEQVCRALEHAHTRGVIHRDLKPGNIYLAEDGTARLGDFGLALSLDRTRLPLGEW